TTIGIAVLRYGLWDIDVIIRRTLIYGALTAGVVGVYALVVGGLSALLPTQSNQLFSIVALVLIALLFQPLRRRLQGAFNRLIPVAPGPAVAAQAVLPAPPVASQLAPLADVEGAPTSRVADEPQPGARQRGSRLALARIAWLAVALVTVGLFLASVPVYFAY